MHWIRIFLSNIKKNNSCIKCYFTLFIFTTFISMLMHAMRLPAPLLFGSMIAALLLTVRGGAIKVNTSMFALAQGMIAVMVANQLPASAFGELATSWTIFLFGTASTLVASTMIGLILQRSHLLPGTTGLWGSSPGGATAMILMSVNYGADMRLVALMQYIRVVTCLVVAIAIVSYLGSSYGSIFHTLTPSADVGPLSLHALAIASSGALIGRWLKVPAGTFLVPLIAATLAKTTLSLDLTLPTLIIMLANCLIGWTVGGKFTVDVLRHASRVFPVLILSTSAQIAICGGIAVFLVSACGIDPLTAYLATTPGGVDAIAIIAMSSSADIHFVLAMQLARLFAALIVAPAVTALLSKHIDRAC
ncbi:AbrB family transcriptional regulator [Neorhizobium sp. DT-125]|uniref:AbrB family transcriptional regulator n=1 Tax=Neorhizobium sp. DT-125 TaxID=3396163 RepID=UPI003F1AA3E0